MTEQEPNQLEQLKRSFYKSFNNIVKVAEWHKRWSRPFLGSGTKSEYRTNIVGIEGTLDYCTFYEEIRRKYVLGRLKHEDRRLEIQQFRGSDSEGKSSVMYTRYSVDVSSGELTVKQWFGNLYSPEKTKELAQVYPNFEIDQTSS